LKSAFPVLREAVASSIAQPATTLITLAVMASMVASVLLTSGKEVGTEDQVLNSINVEGTRTILVTAQPGSGLDSSVVSRIELIHGISWVAAFGESADYVNSVVEGGNRVGVRDAYGSDLAVLGLSQHHAPAGRAFGTQSAMRAFSFADGSGGATRVDGGAPLTVTGGLRVPGYLDFLAPLVIVPKPTESNGPVAVVVVLVDSPADVAPLARAVGSVLAVRDLSQIQLTTSETLARLHSIVANQLGALGATLTALTFGLSAALVTALMYGVVTIRRKDFGRRRALGASRGLIVVLLVLQTAITSAVGAVFGTVGSAIALAAGNDPLPRPYYFLCVAVLAISVGAIAGLVPGVVAARRDPLKELRVP
jgi:putative ABC transport system permease protein